MAGFSAHEWIVLLAGVLMGAAIGWLTAWWFYRKADRKSETALRLQMLAAEDLGAHIAWQSGKPAGITHTREVSTSAAISVGERQG